jgi:hypothetical protein
MSVSSLVVVVNALRLARLAGEAPAARRAGGAACAPPRA